MEIMRGSLPLFTLTLVCVACGDDDPSGGMSPGGQVGEDNSPQGGLCTPCEDAADCANSSARCIVNDQTGERFCSPACSSSSDCNEGFSCVSVNGAGRHCVPDSGSCGGNAQATPRNDGMGESTNSEGNMSEPMDPPEDEGVIPTDPGPMDDSCDPDFLGPFCENDRIIGFDVEEPEDPTLEQVQKYSLDAVNYLRSRTCLPPLVLDSCLNRIAFDALAIGGFHVYFRENCMNAAHDFGRDCECDWGQENIGLAYGTRRTWADGIQVPLCGMMEEPKGVGHRANIENDEWTRLGVGVDYDDSGASWHHEFGR